MLTFALGKKWWLITICITGCKNKYCEYLHDCIIYSNYSSQTLLVAGIKMSVPVSIIEYGQTFLFAFGHLHCTYNSVLWTPLQIILLQILRVNKIDSGFTDLFSTFNVVCIYITYCTRNATIQ